MHVRFPPDFRASPATQSGPAFVLSAATTTPAGIVRAISIQQTIGEQFRAPLFRAVSGDEIAFTVLGTGQVPPLANLQHARRPSLILLTDDDDATRLGPDGWRHANRLFRWASNMMLHATGGRPRHYELAVEGAKASGRLLVVEPVAPRSNRG